MSIHAAVQTLRTDLRSGVPRSQAWDKVYPEIEAPSVKRLLHRFRQELRAFERLLRAKRGGPASNPASKAPGCPVERTLRPTPYRKPRKDPDGLCAACGTRRGDHETYLGIKYHMWVIWRRYVAQRDWAKYDKPMRHRRLRPAHAARKLQEDARALATVHPHLVDLYGRREILRRLGRDKPCPCGCGA